MFYNVTQQQHNNNSNHKLLRIRHCGLFQFRITSEIINQFRHLAGLLGRVTACRKAFTYTGQHNTERRGQTAMP
jgi:hypothetical protein